MKTTSRLFIVSAVVALLVLALPESSPVVPGHECPEPESELAPSLFPESFLIHMKEFENAPLSSKHGAYVDMMRVDHLSSAKVREIGYGFTDDGLKDILRHGGTPEFRTIPRSMTKREADDFLLNHVLPAYGRMVDKVVTVPLSENQRLALISFAFNLGEGNLRKLVCGSDRLNEGNYASVPLLMVRYNRAGGVFHRGLQRRREAEAGIWISSRP
ncbi:MAG: hypothetical protein EOP83_12960 [Verrucomicrobiaceae bacterium]|nr:MAG: hypothetical protein EOP83_12960 [Verrucomicrobiaceae bacterium]